MTDEERAARAEEIRRAEATWPEAMRHSGLRFLLSELDRAQARVAKLSARCDARLQDINSLDDQVAQLREALEPYVRGCEHVGEDWYIEDSKCPLCVPAKAALAATDPNDDAVR